MPGSAVLTQGPAFAPAHTRLGCGWLSKVPALGKWVPSCWLELAWGSSARTGLKQTQTDPERVQVPLPRSQRGKSHQKASAQRHPTALPCPVSCVPGECTSVPVPGACETAGNGLSRLCSLAQAPPGKNRPILTESPAILGHWLHPRTAHPSPPEPHSQHLPWLLLPPLGEAVPVPDWEATEPVLQTWPRPPRKHPLGCPPERGDAPRPVGAGGSVPSPSAAGRAPGRDAQPPGPSSGPAGCVCLAAGGERARGAGSKQTRPRRTAAKKTAHEAGVGETGHRQGKGSDND